MYGNEIRNMKLGLSSMRVVGCTTNVHLLDQTRNKAFTTNAEIILGL